MAAARDRRYVAAYTLVTRGRADRTVLASVATDASWRVDVPGGALGGGADVAIVGDTTGTYQCLLGGSGTTLAAITTSPASGYPAPTCVKVAAAGHRVPARYDPIFEHMFTDWLDVLTDREAPISVFTASPLSNSTGTCFSVEPSAASLAPPIAPGIYCFLPDGTMTAAAISDNTLTMAGPPAPAPPSTTLPAVVTPGPAAPTKAPPAPVPSATG